MKHYRFVVELVVEVDAFTLEDAQEMVFNTFGIGEDCGVLIEDTQVKYIAE